MERERKMIYTENIVTQEVLKEEKWAGLEMLLDQKRQVDVIWYNQLQPHHYNYHIC